MKGVFKEIKFSLEMGYSRADFLSKLSDQNKYTYQWANNVIIIDYQDEQLQLTLGDETLRKVLSANQPILPVSFDFSKMTRAKQEQFMDIFMLKFQRGGG